MVGDDPESFADLDGHEWEWGQFFSGVADTTYRPVVQAVSHPVDTAVGIGHAVAHPLDTASAIRTAVVATGKAALSGDARAIGQVAGTVLSAVATAGAAKAASALVEGAEVGTAASTVSEAAGTASKVDGIVSTIDQGGFEVTGNAKSALQEGNVTITNPSEPGVKLNLRTETHPLDASGNPVRHVNVERVTPRTATQPKTIKNTHITQ